MVRNLRPWILFLSLSILPGAAVAALEVDTTSITHGVKAWYASNPAVPVVDVRLSFEGAGYASDPEHKEGRAAFAAAMLTEGAGNMDSAQFRRALEDRAISITASADEDRLVIHVYATREQAVEAGKLLALALEKPLLAEADQARMKADLTSLLARLEERPGYRAERLLTERAFKKHPYASAPYGTATSIAALSAEDVRNYLNTYVTRGNVLIAAGGDVDASLLDDMLTPVVDALAANDSGPVAVTKTNAEGAGETLRQEMDVPQTTILFTAPAIARDDPRFYAQYLLNYILGGTTLSSRLGLEVRQNKGLVYGISTNLDIKRGAATIGGALATRNANADAALEAVKAVLADVHTKGVTTEECADAKQYALGSFARELDGAGAVSQFVLMMQIHALGEDYIEKREDYFRNVSCGEINEVAAEVLNPSNFLFAIVGGKAEGAVTPIAPATAPRADTK